MRKETNMWEREDMASTLIALMAFVVTLVTILCIVWWPLYTAATVAVAMSAVGVWMSRRR